MAKKRSELDNLFRENLSDYGLSKKEGNWELLNHLLNEQERKKKSKRLIVFVFSFIVILSVGFFLFLNSGEKQHDAKNFVINQKDAASSVLIPSENKDVASSTTNVQAKENSKITENNIQQLGDENIPSKADEENSKQNLRNKNEDSHTVPESNPNIADQLNAAHEIILNTQPNVNAGDPDKTIAHETEISKSLFPDEIINRNDSAFVNATIHETVNQNTNTSDSLVTVSISNNDSLNVVLKNDTVSDVAAKEEIPMQTDFLNWNVYAGIDIYDATNTSLFSQQNISPIIGLEFMYSISPHFNVGLGSLYTLQGGYQLSDTATQETYFFDKNVSQEIIQIRQLHKLYFPLTLYYSIAKRHTVSAAVQLSFLLNTNGDYTEINKISDHATFTQINDVKGYTDGIKPINVAVSLGYKFLLSTNFDLSARITQELKDSYTSGYFYGAAPKPSLSFQTFLIVKF